VGLLLTWRLQQANIRQCKLQVTAGSGFWMLSDVHVIVLEPGHAMPGANRGVLQVLRLHAFAFPLAAVAVAAATATTLLLFVVDEVVFRESLVAFASRCCGCTRLRSRWRRWRWRWRRHTPTSCPCCWRACTRCTRMHVSRSKNTRHQIARKAGKA